MIQGCLDWLCSPKYKLAIETVIVQKEVLDFPHLNRKKSRLYTAFSMGEMKICTKCFNIYMVS